jgi:peptide-methionine (S)-S-oxide reductase
MSSLDHRWLTGRPTQARTDRDLAKQPCVGTSAIVDPVVTSLIEECIAYCDVRCENPGEVHGPAVRARLSRMTTHETATLGGGCFWCLDAVYRDLRGVERVVSGYAGGTHPAPSYEQVCSGATGHAEVLQITFDPSVITYRELLDVFFTIHDPTTLNRQGADVGTQYRSVIFTHSDEQQRIAEDTIAALTAQRLWEDPIVTEVLPAPPFYPAEEYHQDYFRRNPGQGYCRIVIAPKVAKARKQFLEKLTR